MTCITHWWHFMWSPGTWGCKSFMVLPVLVLHSYVYSLSDSLLGPLLFFSTGLLSKSQRKWGIQPEGLSVNLQQWNEDVWPMLHHAPACLPFLSPSLATNRGSKSTPGRVQLQLLPRIHKSSAELQHPAPSEGTSQRIPSFNCSQTP